MSDNRPKWEVPPLYFILSLALMLWIGFAPGSQFVYYPYNYLGVILIPAGFAIVLAGFAELRKAGTSVQPHDPPTAFVWRKFSRNKLAVVGLVYILILFGAAFLLQRLLGFVVPFIFGWIVSRRFIEPEEARLGAMYGEAYDDYLAHVRRWL